MIRPIQMTTDEFLESISLSRYAELFSENDVEPDILGDLSENDLLEMGIQSLGHRKRILKAISSLAVTAGPLVQSDPVQTEVMLNPVASTAVNAEQKERRQVTVVFADLTGYTRLTRELPVEDLHSILAEFYERFGEIIRRVGGTVDRHIGDCVMAVFGAPVSYGNDVERALRATIAMHDAMQEMTRRHGRHLSVHIGVAAGRVLFSNRGQGARSQDFTLTGDSVNLASRLADKAQGGQTLVSHEIHQIVGDSIISEQVAAVEAKGFDAPVEAWRFVEFSHGQHVVNFVGRENELAIANRALESCQSESAGQVLLVRGEAGIGKSAFLDKVSADANSGGFQTFKTLLLDFGLGDTGSAIATIAAQLSGIDPAATESAIHQAAAEWRNSGVLDERGRDFFLNIMGVRSDAGVAAFLDAMGTTARAAGRQATIGRMMVALAHRVPLVCTIEDLHWANAETLSLIAHLATRTTEAPILLTLTTRIEGDPITPAWREGAAPAKIETIDLSPLNPREARALIDLNHAPNRKLIEECLLKAEGNPLFLDQLLRHASDMAGESVPGSIQSLMQSRMDRLSSDDRRILCAASVIGQRFSLEAVMMLAGIDVYDERPLLNASMIRQVSGGFLFSHALIRDAVYQTLLRDEAQALHARAAQWFKGHDILLHAEHLEKAKSPYAAAACLAAARHAANEYRQDTALDFADRGLALDPQGEIRTELLLLRGDVSRDLGHGDASLVAFRTAHDEAGTVAHRLAARIGMISTMRILDQLEDAEQIIAEAEKTEPTADLLPQLSRLHYLKGSLAFPKGDFKGCLAAHSVARDLAKRAAEPELEARALSGLGDAYYAQGRMFRAYEVIEDCLALCEMHHLTAVESANRFMRGTLRIYMNQTEPALDDALKSAALARSIGQLRPEIISRLTAGWVLQSMDRGGEARTQIELGLEAAEHLGAKRFEPFLHETLVRVELAEGDHEAAYLLSTKMLETARQLKLMNFIGPWLLATAALASPRDQQGAFLAEGESLLEKGCVGHNYFRFNVYAGLCAASSGDTAGLRRYSDALDAYTRDEPTPWSDFYISTGRAIADHLDGDRDADPRLRALRQIALTANLHAAVKRIDALLI
jgi:class 3 adenylate cyclase/tetratricopeptide (TPR) repeat protein